MRSCTVQAKVVVLPSLQLAGRGACIAETCCQVVHEYTNIVRFKCIQCTMEQTMRHCRLLLYCRPAEALRILLLPFLHILSF